MIDLIILYSIRLVESVESRWDVLLAILTTGATGQNNSSKMSCSPLCTQTSRTQPVKSVAPFRNLQSSKQMHGTRRWNMVTVTITIFGRGRIQCVRGRIFSQKLRWSLGIRLAEISRTFLVRSSGFVECRDPVSDSIMSCNFVLPTV